MQNADAEHNAAASPLVELRSLTKAYIEGESTRSVLIDVNASIMPGEFVVLLGPSGSGKSTLLNLVSGIDVPTSGEIIVDGIDISRLSERDRTLFRRRNIGLVFQFFNLIPTLNVWENLLLPLEL
ncbi:MAG: ATP-binding cassette domain-containing protein, partial [Chloroflexi bacterium]|nr:ATP-binding cassette domain-containing protein [Chloroflexota bacterium]